MQKLKCSFLEVYLVLLQDCLSFFDSLLLFYHVLDANFIFKSLKQPFCILQLVIPCLKLLETSSHTNCFCSTLAHGYMLLEAVTHVLGHFFHGKNRGLH